MGFVQMSLTNTWLKANLNKDHNQTLIKSDRDGLAARVSPKGKITWQLRYRHNGSDKRVDLGSYPATTLKSAREESARLRASVETGRDPKIVLAGERLKQQAPDTIESIFRAWHKQDAEQHKAQARDILRSFELHLFPALGSMPVDQVGVRVWLSLLEPLAQAKPHIACRVLSNSRQALKWAVKREIILNNPLSDITAKADLHVKKNVGERALDDAEVAHVWRAIDQSRISSKNGVFLKLCLFFGCRNGEIRKAKKSDFDFETNIWTVPAENHKMGDRTGKPLLRPIIEEIKPLIELGMALSSSKQWFLIGGGDKPLGGSAYLSISANLISWVKKHQGHEMPHWSMHDLRKTARTNWSTLTEPHVAEIMLGHRLPGEWQTYDKHAYLEEQTEAYKKWWDRLQSII